MAREKPTRIKRDSIHADYTETHPAYAVVGINRMQSGGPGRRLFQSDVNHSEFIRLHIKHATVDRGISQDWVHGRKEIVAIDMSFAQWGTLLSSMNMGDGVPATLAWLPGEGYLPSIEPIDDRREQLRSEVDSHLSEALTLIDEALEGGKLSKTDRERLTRARQQLGVNLTYVADSFDEHAEKTTERMKTEVEAYLTGYIHRTGITALGGFAPPVLDAGDES